MSKVTILGPPQSSYVRTTRMVCAQKSIEHELLPVELGSEAHRALHPYLRVPIMRHEGVQLFESHAIAHYLNASFPGDNLVPANAADLGRMEQWVSTINCYLYDHIVKRHALLTIIPMFQGKQPDAEAIVASVPEMKRAVTVLETAYANGEWIAGKLSLADLLVGPILSTALMVPDAGAAVKESATLMAVYERLKALPAGEFIDVG